jgi:predicted nuclease of predicted toxin-antitoxin system
VLWQCCKDKRILLDENVPVDTLPVLGAAGIEAESVGFIGWKGLQNGELVNRAREQFDLLLTRDKDFDDEYLKKQINKSVLGSVLSCLLSHSSQVQRSSNGFCARLDV